MSYEITVGIARERYNDLVREAEEHRLVRRARAGRPGVWDRLIGWIRRDARPPEPVEWQSTRPRPSVS